MRFRGFGIFLNTPLVLHLSFLPLDFGLFAPSHNDSGASQYRLAILSLRLPSSILHLLSHFSKFSPLSFNNTNTLLSLARV